MKYIVHVSLMTFFALCLFCTLTSCSQISVEDANKEIERSYVIGYEDGLINGCEGIFEMLSADPQDVCKLMLKAHKPLVLEAIKETRER